MEGSRSERAQSSPDPGSWSGTAFGLRLEADLPVPGLEPGPLAEGDRSTLLRRSSEEAIAAAWDDAGAERLVAERYADGSKMMSVDFHPRDGYRIDAPFHAGFRVALDGSLVECAPAATPEWHWLRPLFAQALPLAAGLGGREVLHASGVVIDGGGVAFVGHSGAGKTSLAVNLVDQGATLLTDDVLALSAAAGTVLAHPGARFANVAPEQIEGLASGQPERLGPVIGRSEKLHLQVGPLAEAAVPLRTLCFLERGGEVERLEFQRLPEPGPALLLAATFLPHVTTPSRLLAQLEVCSLIDSTVATYRLRVPAGVSAAELATIVGARIGAGELVP